MSRKNSATPRLFGEGSKSGAGHFFRGSAGKFQKIVISEPQFTYPRAQREGHIARSGKDLKAFEDGVFVEKAAHPKPFSFREKSNLGMPFKNRLDRLAEGLHPFNSFCFACRKPDHCLDKVPLF